LWEAAEQLSRALGQIASLPGSPALRREQIQLQVDLSNALIHTRGHASPETKAAFDQARALIEQAEALGETPEDPLVAYSVLYGFWVANRMAFNGPIALELAAQFQALAQTEGATVPLMLGHLLAGISLIVTGNLTEGGRNSTAPSRYIIPLSIVCWRRASAMTFACRRWRGAPLSCGRWATSKRPSPTRGPPSPMPVSSATRRR
jgi:hypothetical protein